MADLTRRVILELLARNRAAGELAAFRSQTASLATTIQSVSRSMLAFAGVGGGIYMLGSQLRDAGRQSVDFEYGLAKIATMLDETSMKHLPMLRSEIERMSVQYGKSAADLNAATYTILSNQIPAADAIGVLETNIRAAKGGFTDAAVTVKATVGLLKAYQMETSRAGYVTNIMHKIVQRGNLVFEDVASNIGNVSSSAAVLGVDLEALGATIATLTRAGVPVDKTFTAIRNILNTFKTPTEEASRVAAQLGFNLDYTSIKGSGLINVIQKLSKANERQLGVLMPNVRGFEGFAAGLQNATALGEDYAYMMSNAQAAERNFRIEDATTQSQIDKTRESWNEAKRSFGDQTLPLLVASLNAVNAALERSRKAMKALTPSGPSPTVNRLYSMPKEQRQSAMDIYRQHLQEAAQSGMGPGRRATQNDWREDLALLNKIIAAYQRSGEVQARIAEQIAKQVTAGTDGTSAGEAVKQLTYADEFIAKLKRENELLGMNNVERAQAQAIDQMRAAIQRDIAIGSDRLNELTEAETQAVADLAAEKLRLGEQDKKSTYDVAAAYVRMYDDIDSKTAASYSAREKLLIEEYNLYAETIQDKALLDEWRRNKQEKLAIDKAKGGDDFFGGVRAGIDEMKRELPALGQLGADLAVSFRDGLVDSLADAVFESRNLGDAMEQVARSMARMTFEWAAQNLLSAGLSALGGGLGESAAAVAITTAGTTVATAITTAGATASASFTAAGTTVAAGITTTGAAVVAGMTGAGATISASIITAGATAAAAIAAASAASSAGKLIPTGSAKGNIFGPRGLIPFGKGGILTEPTVFPFANGVGIAGEKGDEAFMPLGRDRMGRLSVHTTGPAGGSGNARLESIMGRILNVLQQRQTIQATVVDHRDVMTRERFEGREGEKLTMYHVNRNA